MKTLLALISAAAIALTGMSMLAPNGAHARAQYAQQTGLPCGRCHVVPDGTGGLKPFGRKFRDNGHKL
jgi:hypothetical protein